MDREHLWGSSSSQYLHASFKYYFLWSGTIVMKLSLFLPKKQIAVQLKKKRNGSTKFSKAKMWQIRLLVSCHFFFFMRNRQSQIKLEKKTEQETGLGNRGCLKVLNDAKLFLNEHEWPLMFGIFVFCLLSFPQNERKIYKLTLDWKS